MTDLSLLNNRADIITDHKKTQMQVIVVGAPNVGKSALFNRMTRSQVTVSNYPGTTVDLYEGHIKIGENNCQIIDTPGMYSFVPITEEERITLNMILFEKPDLVIHVIEAQKIQQMLPLTLQLLETGLPVLLTLNMMDEAEKAGMKIDIKELSKLLGIPVVGTVATKGIGLNELKEEMNWIFNQKEIIRKNTNLKKTESYISEIGALIQDDYDVSKRVISSLLLYEDQQILDFVRVRQAETVPEIQKVIKIANTQYNVSLDIFRCYQAHAHKITSIVVKNERTKTKIGDFLSRMLTHPISGVFVLCVFLYWGIYKFVGVFGAGTIVDFIEGELFEGKLMPLINYIVSTWVPWLSIQDLLIGENGIISLGLRYAIALILPIITCFFLVFAIVEDSGYLPYFALMLDRIFKKLGLSGRAVIPIVLGFGCDTMATLVTRTLPTKKERIISSLLLALAIPCSAQLGIILAVLYVYPTALTVWVSLLILIFLFIGYLSAKVIPGKQPLFFMELPHLRVPSLRNVVTKTYVRVKWYFMEILPLFVIASLLIWVGQKIGLFGVLIHSLEKPMDWIGLPNEAAKIFLYGFFRRDYGAAGLFDLTKQGLLSANQLLIACTGLTLFMPCIAQFLINLKERGWKVGLGISAFVLIFSFTVAYVLNGVLNVFNVSLT